MHQLTSLRSYFYGCDVLSEQKKLISFPAKNPIDVRWEVVEDLPFWQKNRQTLAIKKVEKKGKAVTILEHV
jgi:hypothetical protein